MAQDVELWRQTSQCFESGLEVTDRRQPSAATSPAFCYCLGALAAMTVQEFFARSWDMLSGRAGGPLTFRLIFQPGVAAILAIRAGLKDARQGATPFLWSAYNSPAHGNQLLREGWRDVSTVFMIAVLLDVIYALLVHSWVYPGQTLLVAVVVAVVPYLLIRGPVTRIARRWRRT